MADGKYIFDGSGTSYMTTGFDLALNPTEYSIIWKGKFNSDIAGWHSMIGGSVNGMEISLSNDGVQFNWGGIIVTSGWTNDGLEHTFVLRGANDEAPDLIIDGSVVANGAVISNIFIGAGSNLLIGSWNGGTQFLQGELSYAYFYDRKVTDIEVTNVTSNILNNPQTNLLLEYKANKTSSAWTEEVGGNDATNVGGVTFEEDAPTTTTVEVEWIDSISTEATGNKIYRDDVEIADIANGVQIYQDTTAETGTEYKYEVQAHDGAGDETTQEVEGENMDYITTA